MLVKELMERTGMPSFGMARMMIEDGLTEMCILQESFIRETTCSLIKNQRFYDLPRECIKLTDILVKGHMNSNGEFRSIVRLINKPKIKSTSITIEADDQDELPVVSDVDDPIKEPVRVATDNEGDNRAREYAYFWEGNRLGIVEKDIYSTSTGDIVNDTDAYQRASYNWVSPQQHADGFIKLRYTAIPVYTSQQASEVKDSQHVWIAEARNGTDGTNQIEFYCMDLASFPGSGSQDVSSDIAAGDFFEVYNAGNLTGLWECVSTSTYLLRAKRPAYIYGGASELDGDITSYQDTRIKELGYDRNEAAIAALNTRSLYQHQEDYFLPISMYQAQALMCYIKYRLFEEAGEIDRAMYFEKKFRNKLEKQKTANITGPRMISPGPFALK